MTRLVAAAMLLALAMLLSSCGGASATPEGRLRLEVEQVEMLQLESYPVQLMLHVEGWLPNPCSAPTWEITKTSASEIAIELFALSDGSEACIQVLAPFEANIPLGAQPTGRYRILFNGEALD